MSEASWCGGVCSGSSLNGLAESRLLDDLINWHALREGELVRTTTRRVVGSTNRIDTERTT